MKYKGGSARLERIIKILPVSGIKSSLDLTFINTSSITEGYYMGY